MKIKHLGLIPDGNRRWAKEHGITNREAYDLFTKHICDIILAVDKIDVEMLTIYVVSKENLERNDRDISDVLLSVLNMLKQKIPNIIDELQAKVKCIGVESIKNDELRNIVKEIENISENNSGININFLIGYNPIDELNNALSIGEKISIDCLAVPRCVDLLIRTAGGPIRLSNFLPLQCGYANIEIVQNKFLDLECNTIISIIKKYQNIQPNYGK